MYSYIGTSKHVLRADGKTRFCLLIELAASFTPNTTPGEDPGEVLGLSSKKLHQVAGHCNRPRQLFKQFFPRVGNFYLGFARFPS